jgi:hypothetical protein
MIGQPFDIVHSREGGPFDFDSQKSFAKRLFDQVGGAAADERKENLSWRRFAHFLSPAFWSDLDGLQGLDIFG